MNLQIVMDTSGDTRHRFDPADASAVAEADFVTLSKRASSLRSGQEGNKGAIHIAIRCRDELHRVTAKINSALGDEIGRSMAPTGITVSAENGRVTLAGTSSSGRLRARAEKVTASIAGVYAIDNRIVSVPTRGGLSQSAIGAGTVEPMPVKTPTFRLY
jgi:osmotically-inducible protein OsmY